MIPGVISGGSLIISGSDITLAGGNTYTGTTTITGSSGGFVSLFAANSNALGSTALGGNHDVYVIANSSLSLDAGTVGGGIIIAGPTTAGNKTLHLNGFNLTAGIINGALQNNSGPNTFGGAIILDSNSSIYSNSGLLTLTNTITSSNNSALTLGGAANLQISGSIGSSVSSLIKYGAGTAMLSGGNSYTGQTSLYSGILRLQNSSALGTSLPTVYAGGSLELDGTSANGNLSVSNAVTIDGYGLVQLSGVGANPGSTGGALRSAGGNNTYSGLITMGTDAQINSDVTGGTFTLTGGITGANFGLTIAGSGNTVIGAVGITNISSLTKNDDGVLSLAVANSLTGPVLVNAGTLNLQASSALGNASFVNVASGAAITLQNGQTNGLSVGTLLLNGSGAGTAGQTGALDNLSGTNTYVGPIALGSNATISSDAGSLNLNNPGAILGSGFTLTLAGASTGSNILAGNIATGSGGVIKNGTGTWTLSGGSSYTGATAVNAGTLTLAGTNATSALLVNGGSLVLNAGVLSGAPNVTFGGGSVTSATQTLGNLSFAAASNSSLILNGGSTVTLGAGAWSRGVDSILNVNLAAGGSVLATTGAPTGTGAAPTGTNNIFGYMLVTDSSGTGLGMLNGSNQIVRFNSQTGAATLTGSAIAPPPTSRHSTRFIPAERSIGPAVERSARGPSTR